MKRREITTHPHHWSDKGLK